MTAVFARIVLLLLLVALTACAHGEADTPGSPPTQTSGKSGFYGAASGGL